MKKKLNSLKSRNLVKFTPENARQLEEVNKEIKKSVIYWPEFFNYVDSISAKLGTDISNSKK